MDTRVFIEQLRASSFFPFMGVPCSVFGPLIDELGSRYQSIHTVCTSEGEAMGLAGGCALAGRWPVVYMQNDGYGNAVNPLASLQLLYKLPALLLVSWRGEPGRFDAPQHRVMGESIRGLLERFSIPHLILEDSEEGLNKAIAKARDQLANESAPFAFIVPKGYFTISAQAGPAALPDRSLRLDYLAVLSKHLLPEDVLLGATGFTGRELMQYIDHPGKFYMMGSMGCLPALGLGIARQCPRRRVFVLDGDGALLMKLGSLATVGLYRPANYIHICFDNHCYESTGGQPSAAAGVDFCAMAAACGYPGHEKITTLENFAMLLAGLAGKPKPFFAHVLIRPGTPHGLPRPERSPLQMRDDFRSFLGE
jgi:phosphonopyruvate decarboxylase